jgi:hypothetical protein
MGKQGLLIVMARVETEEEAFNRWYNEEHVPKALARFPGMVFGAGRRKRLLAIQLKALTVG